MSKTILFNAMFSGKYLTENLGHEIINMFAADNGEHYIYINPSGKITLKDEIECVLLGELVRDGVFKVIAIATGLKMLDSTREIIKKMNAKSQEPLTPELKKAHLKELSGVTYGTVAIDKLFHEPTQVLATFKADKVVPVEEDVFIYANNVQGIESGNGIYQLSEAKHDGKKAYSFSKTNPYMYFPEKNQKGETLKDYKQLKTIIEKTNWASESVRPFEPKAVTGFPPVTMVEMMGAEHDELAYSNMIFFWLKKEQNILRITSVY